MKKLSFILALFCPLFLFSDPQVVLVTGASKGIGKAVCEKLAEKGHIVYATMRSPDKFPGFVNSSIRIKALDVTCEEQLKKVVEEVIAEQKKIDVLVNNAGVLSISPCETFTLTEAKDQFNINFFGAFSMMQAVLPKMREQKSGKIINITSTSGFDPAIGLDIYAASKSALETLSESMASYLSHFGVHISLIQPGPVKTDMVTSAKKGSVKLENNPYELFQSHLISWYSERLGSGQNPSEIGDLVDKIMSQENPKFRYQTTPGAVKRAQKNLVDITGCENIKNKQIFSNELFERPIDGTRTW